MNPKYQRSVLLFWHAWIGGSYLVAYLTADEDTYGMHLFAGYAVLAAIVVRVLLGLVMPGSNFLKLPRPNRVGLRDLFGSAKGRHPLFAWFAATLLVVVGAVAATGALSDTLMTWLEDPHEAIAEASLWVIFGHIAFVTFMYGGKRRLKQIVAKVTDRFLFSSVKEHSQ